MSAGYLVGKNHVISFAWSTLIHTSGFNIKVEDDGSVAILDEWIKHSTKGAVKCDCTIVMEADGSEHRNGQVVPCKSVALRLKKAFVGARYETSGGRIEGGFARKRIVHYEVCFEDARRLRTT